MVHWRGSKYYTGYSIAYLKMQLILVLAACLPLAFAVTARREQWTAYEDLLRGYQDDPKLRQEWEAHVKKFTKESKKEGTPLFHCNTAKSNEVPTSVHKLPPGDIKIVGALGDSITAGFGVLANTVLDMIIQDRGHVYSVGGFETYDKGVITLPNILKNYNKNLYGFSTGDGTVDDEAAKFNVAIGGSVAIDLPEQADMIIQRMKEDPNVNMEKDWKMVTIFIGGNDLCRVCFDQEGLGSAAFLRNMRTTLDMLAAGLPRTIVNVVPIMDITPLPKMSADIICDGLQEVMCPCASDSQYHDLLKKVQAEYSSYTANLTTSGKYDTDEFTVVFQPFLRDTKPPRDKNGDYDLSYFAPDCFHFSEKAHKAAARLLWNSLFKPVGSKPTSMNFKESIECPAVGDYIKTNRNSQTSLFEMSNTDNSDRFVDVMATRPKHAGDGGVRSLTMGLAVVGSICGILLVLVAALMVVVIKGRRASEESIPLPKT